MIDYAPPEANPPSHMEIVYDRWDIRDEIQEQALHYMTHLQGWCSDQKRSILIDLILITKPKTIIEIGVWGGKSLVPMAYALKMNGKGKIYGIDPWENAASVEGVMNSDNYAFWSWVDHKAVMNELIDRIFDFELKEQIELIEKKSEDADSIYEIDILHIDGNHTSDASLLDVMKWVPLINSGGWIIFDDMTWYENGVYTTAKAVDWLNEHCIKIAEFSDICVWGLWVKP